MSAFSHDHINSGCDRDHSSESEELPSWTTQCGAQSLRIVQVTQADGTTAWDIDNGKINRNELYFPTLEEAKSTFNLVKSVIESNHQNNLRCCMDPDYALGPTRESIESKEVEEKLAYATSCGRQLIYVVRKTTMTGRDVWDVTNGHDDHPVAMMYDSFADAKASYLNCVEMVKSLHIDCCIIPDHN